MDKSSLTRRKMLSSVGVTGLASVGVLGFMTRGSVRYTKTVPVDGEPLEIDWRETYNGEVQEDTRSGTELSEDAVIHLTDVLPGDFGTLSFQVRNPEDSGSSSSVTLSLVLAETAENEVVDPERESGDDSSDTGELQDFIETKLWYDEGLMSLDEFGGDNVTHDLGEGTIVEGTLAEVGGTTEEVDGTTEDLGTLAPGEEVTVAFRWEFNSDAHSEEVDVTQTDSVNFDLDLDFDTGGT